MSQSYFHEKTPVGTLANINAINSYVNSQNANPNATISAFDEVKTAPTNIQFDVKSIYGISALRDNVSTTGTSTVVNTIGGPEYILTGEGGKAELSTVQRGRYVSGSNIQIGMGIRFEAELTGDAMAKFGYFDETDGIYFVVKYSAVVDKHDLFVEIMRDGVKTTIPRSDFYDKFDGTGPSGGTLDLLKGNIFRIDFTWYGYGQINLSVVCSEFTNPPLDGTPKLIQKPRIIHSLIPDAQTSLKNPNLPICTMIESTTAQKIYIAGRQCSIVGPENNTVRINGTVETGVSVSTTLVPLLSLRRKVNFVSSSVVIESIDIITDQNIQFEIRTGGTLDAMSFGPLTDSPDEETTLERSNSATTITGGIPVYIGLTPSERKSIDTKQLSYNLNEFEIITLCAKTFGGNGTISVCIRFLEGF